MAKKIAPGDNSSNIGNANKGTSGTKKQYHQNQRNRGKQLAGSQQSKQSTKPGGSERCFEGSLRR